MVDDELTAQPGKKKGLLKRDSSKLWHRVVHDGTDDGAVAQGNDEAVGAGDSVRGKEDGPQGLVPDDPRSLCQLAASCDAFVEHFGVHMYHVFLQLHGSEEQSFFFSYFS